MCCSNSSSSFYKRISRKHKGEEESFWGITGIVNHDNFGIKMVYTLKVQGKKAIVSVGSSGIGYA